MAEVCASCKAPVLWVSTENGKRMPVDAEPTERGNIVLLHPHGHAGEPPVAVIQRPDELEQLRAQRERSRWLGTPLRLYTSHFAHCPHADEHRRKGERHG